MVTKDTTVGGSLQLAVAGACLTNCPQDPNHTQNFDCLMATVCVRRYLVELPVAKVEELGKDVEPQVEHAIEPGLQ